MLHDLKVMKIFYHSKHFLFFLFISSDLIHIEFIFVYIIRLRTKIFFFFFSKDHRFSQHLELNIPFFLLQSATSTPLRVKFSCTQDLFLGSFFCSIILFPYHCLDYYNFMISTANQVQKNHPSLFFFRRILALCYTP